MPAKPDADDPAKPRYLDPSALTTPALAIGCAAREALRIGDVIEQMLTGMLTVLKTNDRALAERLRKMDDVVDDLYTAIKLYLTQISREALEEKEGRRWADIVSFTINMEQVGDIIERVITDVEEKKIEKGRNFSAAGMQEICDLHGRLIANLRLGMSVFLHGDLTSAQQLLAEKVLFRDLERAYADSHIERLTSNTAQSIETSSLHLDLISDLKRINSHICSIAYPILEQAGVLAKTRLKEPLPAPSSERLGVGCRRQGRLAEAQAARGLGPDHVNACPPDRALMELTLGVTLAVLGAGFLHAGWNALLKSSTGGDALLDTAAVVAGSSLCALALLAFVPLPDPAAWKFIAASAVHPLRLLPHAGAGVPHRRPLVRVSADARHRAADRRGARHRLPARAAERADGARHRADLARHRQHRVRAGGGSRASARGGLLGVRQRRDHRRPTRWSTAPARALPAMRLSYVRWLIFLEGIPFVAWVLARRGAPGAWPTCDAAGASAWCGGACSLAAYGIVLWAMTRAPIAAVAALRETSVLFAALIGSLWLKEGFGWRRARGRGERRRRHRRAEALSAGRPRRIDLRLSAFQ